MAIVKQKQKKFKWKVLSKLNNWNSNQFKYKFKTKLKTKLKVLLDFNPKLNSNQFLVRQLCRWSLTKIFIRGSQVNELQGDGSLLLQIQNDCFFVLKNKLLIIWLWRLDQIDEFFPSSLVCLKFWGWFRKPGSKMF